MDVVVVGGGPSGLSAALCLARAGRSVLVLDGGPWTNVSSGTVHNFFTRDGATPAELREAALAQLRAYPCARVQAAAVERAGRGPDGFRVALGNARVIEARRLILATGLEAVLPDIPGLPARWGRSVVHCPYCHGWECGGLALGVLALDEWAVHQAIHVQRFSDEVLLCTGNSDIALTDEQRSLLKRRGVGIREEPLAYLKGPGTALEQLVFTDGSSAACQTLFCHPPFHQRSDLAVQLGCRVLQDGAVEVDDYGQTSQPGVYAVGDMAHRPGQPVATSGVAVSAASGVVAAMAVDQELLYHE